MTSSLNTTILCLVFLLCAYPVFSQVIVHGKVIESVSGEAVPFVNIAIPGTYYGTITNNDGVFSIKIPSSYSEKALVFSCVGFQSDTIDIAKVYPGATVQLREKVNELSEVVVMPENALRNLLKRAYEKIPENYAADPVYYKGFYRETLKDDNKNYISFGEALVELVRGDVTFRKDRGQVRLIKSRGGYLSGRDSTTNIHFYGGVFFATSDFVQKRSDFIRPSGFDDYWYTVQKLDGYYKVNFKRKKSRNRTEGYFLLDTLSLAYTEARYYKERNENELIYERLDKAYYCKFIALDGRYYLKYKSTNSTGFDKLKKKKMLHGSEYLSTKILPGYDQNIPEKDQLKYFDVFIDEIGEYSTDYWDDFNIVETDSLLKKSQLSAENVNALHAYAKKELNRKKLRSALSKLSLKYGLSYTPFRIDPGKYELDLPIVGEKFLKDIGDVGSWSINGSFGYFFNPHWAVMFSAESNLEKEKVYRDVVLGLEFKQKINSFGTPHYLSLKAGVGQATSLIEAGIFEGTGTLTWGSKDFDADKLAIYFGKRTWLLKPTLGFSRFLNGKSSVYVDFSYHLKLSSKEVLVLKERSGLFRKSAVENLSDTNVEIWKNDVSVSRTGIKSPRFSITLGINLLR